MFRSDSSTPRGSAGPRNTAQVESALVQHPQCSEAAVVGFPHEIKGEGIWAYVSPMAGTEMTDALLQEFKNQV